jgi:hypothetical protein
MNQPWKKEEYGIQNTGDRRKKEEWNNGEIVLG